MPEVKFSHVVTFSSEDPVFKAENLINSTSKVKKWRSLTEGEPQLTAILQMEKPVQIQSVDIGNDGSAFVEVQVGRKGSLNQDDNFHVLLAAASFLTPMESRNGQNQNRVRMFTADKLNSEVAKQNWDQVKIVCTQPFNKHVKYGLSFIKVHSVETNAGSQKDDKTGVKRLGAFVLKDEDDDILMSPVSVGGLFASRRTPSDSSQKPDPSVAASIRSDATLASIVLSQDESSRKRKTPTGNNGAKVDNSFYQLKQSKEKKRSTKKDVDDSPLPRRDLLPGEKEQKPRRNDSTDSKKKIKIVDRPKPPPPEPKPVKAPLVRESKPFQRLLEGVVFAISGYQNPLRGQIREFGLQLGAKYRPDWDPTCTHLICAFPNTPKFREVKSKRGKIVKKDWLEACNKDRKRYPWRRYCLDPADKGIESETEIWAEDLLPSTSATSNATTGGATRDLDTDEEIENVRKETERKSLEEAKNNKNRAAESNAFDLDTDEEIENVRKEAERRSLEEAKNKNRVVESERKKSDDTAYDEDTDEEIENVKTETKEQIEKYERQSSRNSLEGFDTDEVEKVKRENNSSWTKVAKYECETDEETENVVGKDLDSDEAYDADTDVDDSETGTKSDAKSGSKSDVESMMKGKAFLFYGPFDPTERQHLSGFVRTTGGLIFNFLGSNHIDFIVTNEKWDRNFDKAETKCKNVKFVTPDFIIQCQEKKELVATKKFEISKN